ncbi:axin interactor, dorsalization-associated protein isoform X1 [Echinops telfairi]|uniref:Axin interactor, dorsalization-associated protein isoform X1 n=1 Tax=Echinops telfairi TaxID=9371 RepID=A0AC55DQN8_ECHTE|nr:axin interactor, dorsalization-associated protein isoform X1 [Echinops telfairi]
MSEVTRSLLQRWGASFRRGADFDSWGQLVEAIDEYQILARHLQKEAQAQHNNSEFTEEQKKTIGKIATCLELRSAALQSTQSQEEFKLEDLKKLEPILKNILTYNKEFPFDVQPVPLRRILAPGEEENLEFEEDEEEGGAGAGSPDCFPARVPGTLLPRLPSEPGMTLLTIRIEKIGLKDAGQCIDPYITVSVKEQRGLETKPIRTLRSCSFSFCECVEAPSDIFQKWRLDGSLASSNSAVLFFQPHENMSASFLFYLVGARFHVLSMRPISTHLPSIYLCGDRSPPDLNGIDLTPVQDTPVASRKEDTYVHFNVDIELQKHVEKLTKGAAIFFEFKHYKPKKRFTSTKCFAFMEMDEIKPGPIVIELYKKPTDFKRKKLQLLTKKPLYLHLHQTLHKE